jgi:predicted HicB family RNase H-like nuclease
VQQGVHVHALSAENLAELAAEAERQGVSLNALLVALLAGGIGWKLTR